MSNLDCLKNIESGETIELVKSPFTIGRTLSSDYVIAHRVISKNQCRLERTNKGWVLYDTSTNGSMVNKDVLKHKSVLLKNLDEICFGFHTYTYQFCTPKQTRCSQMEKVMSQEKVARFSPQHDSPNSFDEHGVSDDILNALTDKILYNLENCLEESKEEINDQKSQPDTTTQPLDTESVPDCGSVDVALNGKPSESPISVNEGTSLNVDDKLTSLPSQPLNLNKILDPMGLLMGSNDKNTETAEGENNSQSSVGTVLYSPSEILFAQQIMSTNKLDHGDNRSADGPSQETSEISGALVDKTADLVKNDIANEVGVPAIPDQFRSSSSVGNLVDTANKYAADVNRLVSKNSEVSASSLLTKLANDGDDETASSTTSLLHSNTGSSRIRMSQARNTRPESIMPTKGIISPANANKKRKVSCHTDSLAEITEPAHQIIDLSETPVNVENNVQIQGTGGTRTSSNNEKNSQTRCDIIDLTSSQDGKVDIHSVSNTVFCPTNNAVNKGPSTFTRVTTSTEQPGSTSVVIETPLGCNIKIFESGALPVAHHEVVTTTSMPSTKVTADPRTLSRSTRKAASASGNTLQEPGPSKQDDASKHSSDKRNTLSNKNSYEEMENELLCTICANLFIKSVTLGCSHSFCQYCIDQWKKKKLECPVCRTKISSTTRTLVLDNIIEKIIESAPADERTQRQEAVQARENIEKAEKEAQQRPRQPQTARRGRGGGRRGQNTRHDNNLGNSNNRQQQQQPGIDNQTVVTRAANVMIDLYNNAVRQNQPMYINSRGQYNNPQARVRVIRRNEAVLDLFNVFRQQRGRY